jgi:hypothetical protein
MPDDPFETTMMLYHFLMMASALIRLSSLDRFTDLNENLVLFPANWALENISVLLYEFKKPQILFGIPL